MITTQTLLRFIVRGEQGKDQMNALKLRSCVPLVHLLAHVTWFGNWLKLEWMWRVWICHMGTTLLIRKLLILLNNTILSFKIELFPSCLTPRLNYSFPFSNAPTSLHCIIKLRHRTRHWHEGIAWYLSTNFYLQGPEVRSGDVPQPILLKEGETFNFTINRGVSTQDTVSVNYDDFVNDVEVGDVLLVDGECEWYSLCILKFEINLQLCVYNYSILEGFIYLLHNLLILSPL